jgi:Flp pilus assembly protein TadD
MRHFVLVLAIGCAACAEQPSSAGGPVDSSRSLSGSSAGTAGPVSPAKAQVDSGLMTRSSKSPDALAAFARGRELADNVHEPAAIEEFRKATQHDPSFAIAHACLGYYTPEDEGIKSLDHAIELAKNLPEPERLYVEQLREVRRGNAARARELAARIVEQVPFDWHAQLDLGNRLFAERRLDEAAMHLRKAAAYGPPSVAVLNQLGYVQLTQRDFGGAVGTFRKYTQLRPNEANAFDSLGEALLNSNRLDESEKFFLRAAELDFSHGWSGAAYVRSLRGDEAGAMDALAKSREAAPRAVDKLDVDLIGVWATMRRPAEAKKRIATFEAEAQKHQLAEHHANASVARAVAMLEDGATAEAVAELDTALRRAEHPSLSGARAERLRRTAHAWRAIAQSRLENVADVQKTSEAIDKEAARAPTEADLQSTASLGRGLLALARGDARLSVQELSACVEEDLLCQWQLAVAQDKAGQNKAAEETRLRLSRVKLREPQYLYVHAKVVRDPPATN